MKKSLFFILNIILLSASIVFVNFAQVYAVSTPSFPSCYNPQGTLKVSYSSGTHGIAGDSATYSGSDTVYSLSPDTLAQCFCSTDGKGIQTNWWKISSLTDSEIQILKNEGWIYVPNGSVWGLDDAAYLAKNTDYSCRGGSSSTTDRVGGSSSSNSSDSGSVLATSTQAVLGLASTGNMQFILLFLVLGFASLGFGIVLKKK